MKKILSLIMVLSLSLSLCGCCTNTDQLTKYTASFTIYVSNSSVMSDTHTHISSGDITSSQKLTETYAVIIKSNRVLTAVAENIDANLSTDQLRAMLKITPIGDTEVLQISVTADDSQLALDIAQALAEVVPEQCAEIIDGSNVKIIDSPKVTENTSIFNLLP